MSAGVLVLALGLVLVASIARPAATNAATSDTVNFQAKLMTNTGGVAPDGYYNVEFKLYSASTGGTALWTEDWYDSNGVTAGNDNRVRVANGYLTVNLGGQNPFPSNLNWAQNMYITMNVGGTTQTATPTWDGEMNPRLKLTAVPYAFSAGNLSNYNSTTGFTSTLSFQGATGRDQAIQIPDNPTNATDQVCLLTLGNCFGGAGGGIAGAGTQNFIAKFDNSSGYHIGSSDIYDDGNFVGINNSLSNDGLLSVHGLNATQSSIFVQGTGSASVATAVIKQGASQTGNLVELQDSNGNVNASFNNTGNILALGRVSATGTVTQGQLKLADGTNDNFTLTVKGATLTANSTVTIPNAGGNDTVCLLTLANCTGTGGGIAGLGTQNYIAKFDTVGGNHLSADTTGAYLYDNGTFLGVGTNVNSGFVSVQGSGAAQSSLFVQGAASASAPTIAIKQATSQGGDLLQLVDTSGNPLGGFAANGSMYYANSGFTTTLSTATLSANQLISLPNETGTLCIQSSTACGFELTGGNDFIQNQTASSQSAGFKINGNGTLAILTANTSVLTSLIDAPTAGGSIAIGTTNATGGINLNQNTTIAANKSINFATGTGNFDMHLSSGTFQTGTGNVTLNGDTTVASGKNLTITSGATSLTGATAGGSTALNINTGADSNVGIAVTGTASQTAALATILTSGGNGITISSTGLLSASNGVTITGGNFDQSASTGTFDTGTGAVNFNGAATAKNGLTITNAGSFATQKGADYSTVGSANDVNLGPASLVRLTGVSAQTITGIAGGADGRVLTIINAGTTTAVLKNNDSTDSSAGNLIISGTGADVSIPAGASTTLIYDAGANVWRAVNAASGVNTIGAISNTSNANGATISGTTLNLTAADGSNGGVLTAGTQTIGGDKTFAGLITGNAGLNVSGGAISLQGNAASSITTTVGDLTLDAAANLNLGHTSATGITIGHAGITTEIQGNAKITLSGTTGTTLVCQNASSLLSACDSSYLAPTASNFIQNQTASAQTGGFNIAGNGTIGGSLTVNGTILTNTALTFAAASNITTTTGNLGIDAATNITIGTTNATGVTIGRTGQAITLNGDTTSNGNITVAAGKSITIVGGNTASRPASPTEGMLYYDTTTKRLIVYSNGKWQADRSTATVIVGTSATGGASSAVASANPDSADFVNTSTTNAETVINSAIASLPSTGGTVYLMDGTYIIGGGISLPNNITLTGAGTATIIKLANGTSTAVNIIGNSDTSTGTNITVSNLKIDGNSANVSNVQNGIGFTGVGNFAANRSGARIENVSITSVTQFALALATSANNIVANNIVSSSTNSGVYLGSTTNTVVSNNIAKGNTYGIALSSGGANTVTGNVVEQNTTAGIYLATSTANIVSNNQLYSNGGTTTNNGIYLTAADNNTISSNLITDTSATTNNYAINIFDATSDTNQVTGNNLNGGTINDAGTGTIYGGQLNGSGVYNIQESSGIQLTGPTTVSGNLTQSGGTFSLQGNAASSITTTSGNLTLDSAATLQLGTTNATAVTIGHAGVTTTIQGNTKVTLSGTTGTTLVCQNGSGLLSSCTNTYETTNGTDFIQNQTASTQSAGFKINGTGTVGTIQIATTGSIDTSAAGALNIGLTSGGNATSINLNQNVNLANGVNLTFGTSGNFDQHLSSGTFQTGTGNVSINGAATASAGITLTNGGSLATQKGTDFATAGTSNDVAFGAASLYRLTGASAQTITGIAGGTDGRILTIVNAGSNTATLANMNAGSAAANQITSGTGGDVALPAGSSITLIYDAGASLWRVTGSTAASGGAGVNTVGTISSTSNANGATITGTTLNLTAADGTNGGVLTAAGQTIGGLKTFQNGITSGSINTTAGQATSLGNSTGTLTVTGNASTTFVINGATIDATEFGRLDGKDAPLVDTNDAVATAITGTGTLTSGAINWSGNITTSGNISTTGTGTITSASTITGTQLISTVATGTAPLTVSSTTLVTNLNADLLDGQHGSFYQDASNLNAGTIASARVSGSYTGITGVGTITTGTWQGSTIGVSYGGTGATTFTSNGVLYGNGTGALQATAAPTAGQVLLGNGTAPTFTTLGGDIASVSSAGSVTIANSAITSAKILDGTVTGTDIASSTITNTNLASGTFSNITGTGTLTAGAINWSGAIATSGNISTSGTGTITSAGIITANGGVNVANTGSLSTAAGASFTTPGTSTNAALNTASFYTMNTSGAAQVIQGITAGRDGQRLTLTNVNASAVTLANNNGSATGAKIITGTGNDISIVNGASVELIYDNAASVWRVVGGVGGTSVTTIGAISGTANANGATITGNTLNLTAADGSNGGVLTYLGQTIGGLKTFQDGITSTNINTTAGQPTNLGNSTGNLTITGNSSTTFVINGTTVDATEFNRLDGKDAPLVDTNDAVATAITGTGTLTSGSINWSGNISTSGNITTTGSGTITAAGLITANGGLTAANINTTAGQATSLGNTTGAITFTGNSGTTFVINGQTVDATEFNRLDGKDAPLVDTNDAVNTAITGTGTLTSGSINWSGAIATSGNISTTGSGTITSASTVQGTQLISTVATGTAPLTVSSTTLVTNLNADLLDGQHGSFYQDASNLNAGTINSARVSGNYTGITGVGTITTGTWQGSTVAVSYGGTGATTLTSNGVLYGNGTGAVQATAAGTAGQVLLSNAGTPTFTTLGGDIASVSSAGSVTIANSAITSAKILDGTIANADLSTGTFSNITGTGTLTAGSINWSGNIATSGNISTSGSGTITSASTVQGTQLISTVATGTAPLTVSSTTLVSNLNADLLDGQHGSFYQDASNLNAGTVNSARISGSYTGITGVGTITTGTWQGTAIADAYVSNSLTLDNTSTVDWTALNNYPGACGAGTAITQLGDTVTCSSFVPGSASNFLARNAADTSTVAVGAAGNAYVFTNSSSAVASGVLKLDNGSNTNSTISVVATGNPSANNALIFAKLTNAAAAGNLIDLWSGPSGSETSKFSVSAAGAVAAAGNISGSTLTSTVATGTAPLTVSSTTLVSNLNADLLDGQHGSFYQDASNLNAGTVNSARISGSYTGITGVGTITTGTWQGSTVGVSYGGTGATTLTSNGVLYGNGTGAVQATAAGTAGQLLLSNAGTPTFTTLGGDIASVGNTGSVTIANSAITSAKILDGTIANADLSTGTFANITGTGTLTAGAINWSGAITTSGNISTTGSGTITSASTVQGTQLISTVATGTAPLTVSSTTVVTNLNADLLDGQHGSFYQDATNLNAGTVASARISGSYTGITGLGTITTGTWQGSTVGVSYGGTGATTFTSNGVLYGNGTGALQATAAPTAGQVLLGNGTTPTFTTLGGDIASVSSAGSVTIANSSITSAKILDGTIANADLSTGTFGNITGTGTLTAGAINWSGAIATSGNISTSGTGTITSAGVITANGGVTVANTGSLVTQRGADFSTTGAGTGDNVNFGAGSLFRLTGASTQTITGITNGVDGRMVTLINAAAQPAVIANENSNSTAGNRILTGTGGDINLPIDASITMVYDSGASRWRVTSSVAASGGVGVNSVGTYASTNHYANGASISGTTITLGSADATHPGLVDTSAQTFAGAKTFSALLTGNAGLTVSGATSLTGSLTQSGGAVSLTGNASSSLTTTTGTLNVDGPTLTLGTSAATSISLGNTSSSLTIESNGTANLFNGATAHTIQLGTGAAAQTISIGSTNSTSSLALNAGTGGLTIQTQGTGVLGIGNNAVAQTIQIGNTTGATSLALQGGTGGVNITGTLTANNNVTIGANPGSGTVFTNNGATVNTTLNITSATGAFGTAAATVDIYTSFAVNSTAASQMFTVPSPFAGTTYGRTIYVSNIGTNSFSFSNTYLTAILKPGATASLIWENVNGTANWTYAGSDGSGILNQTTQQTNANFNIAASSGTAATIQGASNGTALAVTATGTTGIAATFQGGNVGFGTAAPAASADAEGGTTLTGTGTITTSTVSANVTGTGTAFTTQLHSGDMICAAGSCKTVATITSDTALSLTGSAFPSNNTNVAFTYKQPSFRAVGSNNNNAFVVQGGASSDKIFLAYQSNGNYAFYIDPSGGVVAAGSVQSNNGTFTGAANVAATFTSGSNAAVTFASGNSTTTSSGNVTIQSGSATGATFVSGNISIDNGAATSGATAGTISIGTTNSTGVTIGRTGQTITLNSATTSNGTITVASGNNLTVSGGATSLTGASNGTALAVTATGTTGIAATFQGGGVGVGTASPVAQLEVKAPAGTSSGAVTMTASNGASTFTTSASMTLNRGDYLVPTTSTGQATYVNTTATGTSFTSFTAFTANVTAETFTVYHPTTNFTDNSGTSQLEILGNGTVSVGNFLTGSINPTIKFAVNGQSVLNGNIYAPSISNGAATSNAQINLNTTGTVITRNIADANAALTITQTNASSTGNILTLQNSGGTVGSISVSGAASFNGTITTGSGAGTGGIVNNGSTVNTTLNITSATGAFGTAAATVDIYTSFAVNSTAASQTFTVPSPFAGTTYGRTIYVSNIGTNSFSFSNTYLTAILKPGATASLIWENVNGTANWTYAGSDGSGILNQTTQQTNANFNIDGTGKAANFDGTGTTLGVGTATTGALTLGNGTAGGTNSTTVQAATGGVTIQTAVTSGGGNSGGITLQTGAANSGSNNTSGSVSITTGNATGGNASSGGISIDVGSKTGTGTAGSITIGTGANAPAAITISKTGGATTNINGNITFGSGAGSGTVFTNNGATVNTTLNITSATGAFGTAAATVDIYTSFAVSSTAASQVFTVPTPFAGTTYGRTIYVSNIGTNSFTFTNTYLTAILKPGATASLIWENVNGTANWTYAGADGNGILNQTTQQTSANFNIDGTGKAAGFDATTGALAIGGTTATSILEGNTANTASWAVQGATAATYDIGTTTGTGQITVGKSTDSNTIAIGNGITANTKTQTVNIATATGNGGTAAINIGTSATAGSTSTIVVGSAVAGTTTLQSAGGTTVRSTTVTSGSILTITQNTSAFTGTAALINLANGSGSAASGKFIDFQVNGNSKFNVDVNGVVTIGTGTTTTAGTGGIVNNGSTVNTTLVVNDDSDGGNLGGTPAGGLTAAQSVDNYTSISVNQTTGNKSITLPSPTASTTYGRLLYVSNVGTASFTFTNTYLTATLKPGATASLMWENVGGTPAWTYAGADGSGILNQTTQQTSANFNISGTGQAQNFDSTSGALGIGNSVATGVTIGNTTNTASFLVQGTVAATYTIGTGTGTGQITLGQSNDTNIITIGSGATASTKTQTVNIATATGNGGTAAINIGTSATAGSTSNITIGSTIAGTTTLQSAGGTTANYAGTGNALTVANTGNGTNLNLTSNAATSATLLNISQNTVAYTGTAIKLNIANGSGSFASGKFIDFQTNGTSKFNVDASGAVTIANTTSASSTINVSTNTTPSGTNAVINANDTSGTSTDKLLSLKLSGSEVFGVDAAGNVKVLPSASIDTNATGTLNFGTANATTINIGRSSGAVTQAINIGTNNTASSTSNITIGSTVAGTTTLQSAGGTLINTPVFTTSGTSNADANCFTGGAIVHTSCSITSATVSGFSAVIVGFDQTGQVATLPDPTVTTPGKVIYVTAANGSSDFTLRVNGGGTGNDIAMRQNTTATMIWNGNDWTAAGASSSTTLQAAYDNTLTSAGGAELLLSNTSNHNGLTIRDSSTNPVGSTLLEVQNSSAASVLSVNANVTDYANNGGAESTFASDWSLFGTGSISRNTTSQYVATGTGSVNVSPTAGNSGVKNTLTSTLTANQHYNVSFAAKLDSGAAAAFTDLNVYYSKTGSALDTTCTNYSTQTIPRSVWVKVNCTLTIPASGMNASNAIAIVQVASATRTWYVDNLSVTIAADLNYATDGGVDDNTNFGTNWTAVNGTGGAVTASRSTTDGNDTSDSAVANVTTGGANAGIRNLLSIAPLGSTNGVLYRMSVYAKLNSGAAFSDFKVRYSPDGGTTFKDCTDYNTQTVVTTGWTQITCYITTDNTTVTTPYAYFVETASGIRSFSVDTFSMTLASSATPNVQIGGGITGGPTTLLTLDRAASAPIAANNDALLGSMYYDTTQGKIQCYQASGWGSCGAASDTIVTISPEYTNAVFHGPSGGTAGVGVLTSDFCSNYLHINDGTSGQDTICGTNETYNYYKWTSPQNTAQTYGIYVTYQLPSTFKSFTSGSTSILGRTDNGSSGGSASMSYKVYKSNASGMSQCGGSGASVAVSSGTSSAWSSSSAIATGVNDPSTCGFSAGDKIVFEIDMTASQTAKVYVSNLGFTFSNK